MQFCTVLNYLLVDVYANNIMMIHHHTTTESKNISVTFIIKSNASMPVWRSENDSSGRALHVNKERCANGVVVCLTLSWWDGTKEPPVSAY